MDALYQSTVVPAAVAALITALPLPQIADGVVADGAAGSGLSTTPAEVALQPAKLVAVTV